MKVKMFKWVLVETISDEEGNPTEEIKNWGEAQLEDLLTIIHQLPVDIGNVGLKIEAYELDCEDNDTIERLKEKLDNINSIIDDIYSYARDIEGIAEDIQSQADDIQDECDY